MFILLRILILFIFNGLCTEYNWIQNKIQEQCIILWTVSLEHAARHFIPHSYCRYFSYRTSSGPMSNFLTDTIKYFCYGS